MSVTQDVDPDVDCVFEISKLYENLDDMDFYHVLPRPQNAEPTEWLYRLEVRSKSSDAEVHIKVVAEGTGESTDETLCRLTFDYFDFLALCRMFAAAQDARCPDKAKR